MHRLSEITCLDRAACCCNVPVSNLVTQSHTSPRQRRKQSNTKRILDAALEIVAVDGLDQLALHRVAERTDYTRAALYRYFDSKEALVAALAVCVIDEILANVLQRLSSLAEAEPLSKLRAAVDEYRRFAETEPAKFGMLSVLMADARVVLADKESSSLATGALERALPLMSTLIAQATDQGALNEGDAESRAAVIFAAVHGVLQLRKQTNLTARVGGTEALCNAAVTALLVGWGASADAGQGVIL